MTGLRTDANPGTVADWRNGAWYQYENDSGNESDIGGFDTTMSLQVTEEEVPPPFLLEAGITSSWFDRTHDGEGFVLQMLTDNAAVMYWFTYDAEGAQDWYVAIGEVRANRIVFPELYRVSGGEFGPGFDPEKVSREVVGSASFIWSDCDQGDMSYQIGNLHGRLQLSRITRLMGIDCGNTQLPPEREEALLSGSWFDRHMMARVISSRYWWIAGWLFSGSATTRKVIDAGFSARVRYVMANWFLTKC